MAILSLSECNSWYYQLQGTPPKHVDADLVVIDIDEDPTSLLDGRRQVAAYLSIGEAEDYRAYWQKLPASIILPENPKWPGNYPVRFWDPRWQRIIIDRAQEAQRKGFTALYLDKVDVVDDLRASGHAPQAVDMEMYVFMLKIRTAVPGMAIIQQNCERLLPLTHRIIDACAKEDLYYGEEETGILNDPVSCSDAEFRLRDFGKPVFLVEYLDRPVCRSYAQTHADENGWPIFFDSTERKLDGRHE